MSECLCVCLPFAPSLGVAWRDKQWIACVVLRVTVTVTVTATATALTLVECAVQISYALADNLNVFIAHTYKRIYICIYV